MSPLDTDADGLGLGAAFHERTIVGRAARGARVELGARWTALRTDEPHRVLSFAPCRGGFTSARGVVIHEVRNADLPVGFDWEPMVLARTDAIEPGAVAMLTSRTLTRVDAASASHEGTEALVLATAGLSNAVAVGDTPGPLRGWGTINVVCRVDAPLTDVALVEALSVVAEARTAAVLELGVGSRRSERVATGTGTDCIAVLAPLGGPGTPYAGKHTAIGHVVGAATLTALRAALSRWMIEVLR